MVFPSPSHCSWLRLLAPLFKRRLRPGTGTTPSLFLPMAVLRNETLAYKPENTSGTTPARTPSSAAEAPPASFRAFPVSPLPPSPAPSTAQAGPIYHAQPLPRDLSLTRCTPHAMPSPPFVISGTLQDVCDQLEQWAAQEDRWLQTG